MIDCYQWTIERLIEWRFNQSSIIIDDCSDTRAESGECVGAVPTFSPTGGSRTGWGRADRVGRRTWAPCPRRGRGGAPAGWQTTQHASYRQSWKADVGSLSATGTRRRTSRLTDNTTHTRHTDRVGRRTWAPCPPRGRGGGPAGWQTPTHTHVTQTELEGGRGLPVRHGDEAVGQQADRHRHTHTSHRQSWKADVGSLSATGTRRRASRLTDNTTHTSHRQSWKADVGSLSATGTRRRASRLTRQPTHTRHTDRAGRRTWAPCPPRGRGGAPAGWQTTHTHTRHTDRVGRRTWAPCPRRGRGGAPAGWQTTQHTRHTDRVGRRTWAPCPRRGRGGAPAGWQTTQHTSHRQSWKADVGSLSATGTRRRASRLTDNTHTRVTQTELEGGGGLPVRDGDEAAGQQADRQHNTRHTDRVGRRTWAPCPPRGRGGVPAGWQTTQHTSHRQSWKADVGSLSATGTRRRTSRLTDNTTHTRHTDRAGRRTWAPCPRRGRGGAPAGWQTTQHTHVTQTELEGGRRLPVRDGDEAARQQADRQHNTRHTDRVGRRTWAPCPRRGRGGAPAGWQTTHTHTSHRQSWKADVGSLSATGTRRRASRLTDNTIHVTQTELEGGRGLPVRDGDEAAHQQADRQHNTHVTQTELEGGRGLPVRDGDEAAHQQADRQHTHTRHTDRAGRRTSAPCPPRGRGGVPAGWQTTHTHTSHRQSWKADVGSLSATGTRRRASRLTDNTTHTSHRQSWKADVGSLSATGTRRRASRLTDNTTHVTQTELEGGRGLPVRHGDEAARQQADRQHNTRHTIAT